MTTTTEQLITVAHTLAVARHVGTEDISENEIATAVASCAELLGIQDLATRDDANSEIRVRVLTKARWPEYIVDTEALGVIAYVSTPDVQIEPELFPGRVAELGRHEEGWSLGMMLWEIYKTANEATRKVIDGDALGIPQHVWDLMTGKVVEL